MMSKVDSVKNLRNRINTFVAERDWAQFHTPKNLAMAMIVEAAELVEQFQFLSKYKFYEEENNLIKLEEQNYILFVV
jgi:NTP pyrophosphatase (non-canonical NTP hydrolase)